MKKIIICLLFVPFIGYSQMNFDVIDGVFTMQGIVECDLQKQEIYNRILDWYSETFRSAEDVINYDNFETGKISGNFINAYPFGLGSSLDCRHKLLVEFKDKKARITIDHIYNIEGGFDIENYLLNRKGEYRSMYKTLRNNIMQNGNVLYKSLTDKLNKEISNDNW